jgi:Domain of unknown function (DUF4157)
LKTAESKIAPSAAPIQRKSESPFFDHASEQGEPFFTPSLGIQTKLTVGQPNDKYEQEADSVADKVVQRLAKSETTTEAPRSNISTASIGAIQPKCATCEEEKLQRKEELGEDLPEIQKMTTFASDGDDIQRKCAACEAEEQIQKKDSGENSPPSEGLGEALSSSKGGGSPLPDTTRSSMESAMGADFSNVRIHTGSNAVQMSQDLNAHAFTHGNDVYFNEGKYDTGSSGGQHLLAHELVHTVQQNSNIQKKEVPQIQRGWLGDAWDSVTGAVSDAAEWVGDTASDIASGVSDGVSSAWNAATTFLGDAASSVWSGLSSLGSDVLGWLSSASASVWESIKWFGSAAGDFLATVGTVLWEKLSVLGTNVWSFLSNIPTRLWHLVVHGWDGITGVLGWAWDGLSGAASHIWDGMVGVFSWLGEGIAGAANWILSGVVSGFKWAIDFITDPSLSKLWSALTGSLSWAWSGLKGFAQWGWEGIKGAAVWAWEGVKGFASWLWDGVLGGLEWAGRLLLYVLDLVGFWERLQILWGRIFRMRKLTSTEIAASLEVHPAGMIPYELVRVDEGSLVALIAGKFSGYRAVTTAHILHVAPNEDMHTMVHELSHVAQYEHVGSVYMAEAIHAQATAGYKYTDDSGAFLHQHFWEFNREQQAQICEDYYKGNHGLGGYASAPALQPFVDEMRSGQF